MSVELCNCLVDGAGRKTRIRHGDVIRYEEKTYCFTVRRAGVRGSTALCWDDGDNKCLVPFIRDAEEFPQFLSVVAALCGFDFVYAESDISHVQQWQVIKRNGE